MSTMASFNSFAIEIDLWHFQSVFLYQASVIISIYSCLRWHTGGLAGPFIFYHGASFQNTAAATKYIISISSKSALYLLSVLSGSKNKHISSFEQ